MPLSTRTRIQKLRQIALPCRVGAILAAHFIGLLICIAIGQYYNFEQFFITLAVLPFFVFDRREGNWIRFALFLSFGMYAFMEGSGYRWFSELRIFSENSAVLYAVLLLARFGLLVVGVTYIFVESERAQARLNLMVSELRESARTSRALLSALPDVMYRVSSEGRFLDYSCHQEDDLFLRPEKLVGKRVTDVLPTPFGAEAFLAMLAAIETGKMQFYSFRHPDGKWFDLRIKSSGASEVIIISQNVTARKEAEETIRDQQAKGATASKMAALGEMASGIAHEINNPLAVIHGSAQQLQEMLEGGEVDAPVFGKVTRKIEATSMRISKIIKALRIFARDGQEDPFERVAVQTILDDTLELCRERLLSRAIDLRVSPVPESAWIECRPVQISQVLLNLLNNAHDAVEGLSEKWIDLAVLDRDENVEICVTDSGLGIPEEIRGKILQPFFTTKGVGKGTGLGLSISKGIIDSHQGSFVLDPAHPNTRFSILLPKFQKGSRRAPVAATAHS